MKKHNSNTIFFGSSLIVLSTLFYGSYGVWTRLMGNSFGPYMQAWIKSLLVILILLPFAIMGKQKWQSIRWKQDKYWLFVWVLANWLIAGPLYYAMNHIGIGLATLMMYSGYLLSMFFFGWILNKEKYDRYKLMATILALAGLVLVFTPSLDKLIVLPFAAATIAGVGIGLDMVIAQRIRYNSSQTTIMAWATGAILSLPAAFILHEHVPAAGDGLAWFYLLVFALVCVAASWSSIHGVKLIEAGSAGILGLLEVVWAILFGIVFFNERPDGLAYLGALLIISAAAIPYFKEYKSSKAKLIEEMPS